MESKGLINLAIKVIIVSIIVGFIMSLFGLTPIGVWEWAFDSIAWAWDTLAGFLDSSLIYLITGAAIVVPLYALSYFFSRRRNR